MKSLSMGFIKRDCYTAIFFCKYPLQARAHLCLKSISRRKIYAGVSFVLCALQNLDLLIKQMRMFHFLFACNISCVSQKRFLHDSEIKRIFFLLFGNRKKAP